MLSSLSGIGYDFKLDNVLHVMRVRKTCSTLLGVSWGLQRVTEGGINWCMKFEESFKKQFTFEPGLEGAEACARRKIEEKLLGRENTRVNYFLGSESPCSNLR